MPYVLWTQQDDAARKANGKAVNEARDAAEKLQKDNKPLEALRVLEEELARQTDPAQRATLQVNIGRIKFMQRRLSDALDDLSVAMKGFTEDMEEQRVVCYVRMLRGRIYLQWGMLERASDELREAERLLERLDAAKLKSIAEHRDTHVLEAEILRARQAYDALEKHVAEVLTHPEFHEGSKSPKTRARLTANIGIALKEAARLDPTRETDSRAALSRALEGTHIPSGDSIQPELAKPLLDLPSEDRILPELAMAELELRARDWVKAQGWIETVDARLPTDPDDRLTHPLFLTWKSLQARLLIERTDSPAEPAALETMRDALAKAHEALLREFASRDLRPGGYGFLLFADRLALVSELVRLELALAPGAAGVERALGHLLAVGDVGTVARKIGAPPADLELVRAELMPGGEQHAILVYFPAGDRSHLFVVRAKTVEHHFLAAWDFIDAARVKACESLTRPLGEKPAAWELDDRRKACADLADFLLPREARNAIAECKRITVVREFLGDVPLEALSIEDGTTLGTTKAITHVPSPSIGLVLAARARSEPRLGAGDPASDVALVGLPRSARDGLERVDVSAMLTAFPESRRRLRTDADATLEQLGSAMAGAEVTHLFAHGSVRRERERSATVVLESASAAGPAFVGADEFELLDASPLVFLAVCKSAFGAKRRGDGSAADLAGGIFVGPRARCVVQSSFDIEVRAAEALIRSFGSFLAAGDDPAEAMRKAREALSKTEGFSDPFYYDLIQVVGAGHDPIFAK